MPIPAHQNSFLTPTWANYQEIWLRSIPENGTTIAYFLILSVVILICLLLFAKYIPIENGYIYLFVVVGFVALLWGIPHLVETAKFYDYFINTIIVTVGTVVISISIGCLSAYSLARYSGVLGVIVLICSTCVSAPSLG